ncbi:MAG TPA: glycosyltransferase family 39 protein [Gemmatimonadaceae bacterium]|nr:glycosyltransferase family 39 protein [Gemmatimonadaceae bacterium]
MRASEALRRQNFDVRPVKGLARVKDSMRPTDPAALALWVIVAAVALKLAMHVTTAIITPYEIHRDEFLYLAMGEHLRLWGMDFPPAIAILAQLMRHTVGVGLGAIRIVPALFSTVLVVISALTARELGGGRYAQALAALLVIASAAFMRTGVLFQPVVFDQLAWTVVLFALLKLGRTEDPRWWILVGVAGGFGLLAKFSIGIIGVAVLVAMIILPERRWLATRWPWLAAAIALIVGSPSIVGQIRTGWPAILYARELGAVQLMHVTVGGFLGSQLEMLGPALFLAIAGLWELLKRAPFRMVALTCIGALAILVAMHGKGYYLLPVYPVLFGAGAEWAERVSDYLAHSRGRAIVRAAIAVVIVGYGVFALPFGLPVLQPETMARYATMGPGGMVTTNTGQALQLPQDYADMLGWRERVEAVARVYDSLPPEQRAKTVIATDNYGQAGAVDYYGPTMGLPHAICTCGTYWFFGPGTLPGEVVVTLGLDESDVRTLYGNVQPAGRIDLPWSVPEERNDSLYVGTDPAMTLQQFWPSEDPRAKGSEGE